MHTLVVSYWHIGFENFPTGSFQHRVLNVVQAQRLIETTQVAGKLVAASHDSLFAPCKENEVDDRRKLSKILSDVYGIRLPFDKFMDRGEEDQGEISHSANPLGLFRISKELSILVITCSHGQLVAGNHGRKHFKLEIAKDTVEFHLFEQL